MKPPPRNGKLPSLLSKGQTAMNVLSHAGGAVGFAANLAGAAMSGASGATSLKGAALDLAAGVLPGPVSKVAGVASFQARAARGPGRRSRSVLRRRPGLRVRGEHDPRRATERLCPQHRVHVGAHRDGHLVRHLPSRPW
jgi:hypothetical protein